MSSLVEQIAREDGQRLRAPSMMDRLRRETSAEHARLERVTRMMAPDLSVRDYQRYLMEMWAVHAAVEPRLAGIDGLAAALPDVEERCKLPLLELDLAELGILPGELAALSLHRPQIPCDRVAEALGVLYVLEGSTLGGRLIRQHLAGLPGLHLGAATRYLDAYSNVGAMWKRFGTAVNVYGDAHPEAGSTLVAAAVATFRALLAGWNGQ